jgi:preprotein translocase subunit SecE
MAQAKEKVNYTAAIKTFFTEVVEEAKKIVWPSRDTMVQSTLVVLSLLVVLSIYMALTYLVWSKLFQLIAG